MRISVRAAYCASRATADTGWPVAGRRPRWPAARTARGHQDRGTRTIRPQKRRPLTNESVVRPSAALSASCRAEAREAVDVRADADDGSQRAAELAAARLDDFRTGTADGSSPMSLVSLCTRMSSIRARTAMLVSTAFCAVLLPDSSRSSGRSRLVESKPVDPFRTRASSGCRPTTCCSAATNAVRTPSLLRHARGCRVVGVEHVPDDPGHGVGSVIVEVVPAVDTAADRLVDLDPVEGAQPTEIVVGVERVRAEIADRVSRYGWAGHDPSKALHGAVPAATAMSSSATWDSPPDSHGIDGICPLERLKRLGRYDELGQAVVGAVPVRGRLVGAGENRAAGTAVGITSGAACPVPGDRLTDVGAGRQNVGLAVGT